MADIITDGLKHDGGKPRLDLVPPELIEAVGTVMTHGAEKYGEASYKQVKPQRYRSALMRHICKWLKDPHGKDEDSGLPHLWHIACNVAFLLELDKEDNPNERTLTIVRVRFNTKTDKTYDYEYISGTPIPPCKVGDVVYYVHETFYDNEYMKAKEDELDFSHILKIVERPNCKTNLMLEIKQFDWSLMDSWLKGNIFLTKEEAESKLKELNDNE